MAIDNSEYGLVKTALRKFRRADLALERACDDGDVARIRQANLIATAAKKNLFRLMKLFKI